MPLCYYNLCCDHGRSVLPGSQLSCKVETPDLKLKLQTLSKAVLAPLPILLHRQPLYVIFLVCHNVQSLCNW